MNKQPYYDNNANNIEYFALHKPKIEVKKKREDIREFSDSQLVEKLDDVEIKLQGLSEMYQATKAEKTLDIISKLTGFKTAIRIEMRQRKLDSLANLRNKIAVLEQDLKNRPISDNNLELEKKVAHYESIINSLKGELMDFKKKQPELILKNIQPYKDELSELKKVIRENKESEKTKRHAINVKNDKYICAYLLEYIKNTVSESDYQEVIEDMNEIREKNK